MLKTPLFLIENGECVSMSNMDLLTEIVDRVVEVAEPQQVVLFGSMARGNAGPNSDVDLLVVVPDGTRRLETAKLLHKSMFGIPAAVDFVVATVSDINRNASNIGLIYRTIVREGRVLYAA
jgi:predicted nucleotidyltransferase